jgi:hypothetical protein
MGIYYYAINHDTKQYFTAPGDYSIKSGCFSPGSPFPSMLAGVCYIESGWFIVDDIGWEIEDCIDDGYKDITNELWKTFKEKYPDFENETPHVVLNFDTEEDAKSWHGWWLDGGGEQDAGFITDLEKSTPRELHIKTDDEDGD